MPDDPSRGAGIMPICIETGNVLLGMRPEGDYCSIGGHANYSESFAAAALREFQEETYYDGPLLIIKGYLYHSPVRNFQYMNFIGLVPHEFTPTLDESHMYADWVTPSQLYGGSLPLKKEFEDFIFESRHIIEKLLVNFGILHP